MDPPSQPQNDELRPYRACYPANRASATLYHAEKSRTEDYGEPEADYNVNRDLWYISVGQTLPRDCVGTPNGHAQECARTKRCDCARTNCASGG